MSKISLALPAWAPPLFPERGVQKFLSKVILLMLTLFVSGCSQANSDEYSGANIKGVNHTEQGINHFSVNGYGGSLSGNTCCVMLPDKWYPGMQAKIEWETDPNPTEDIPMKTEGFGYEEKAYAKHAANYQQHSVVVDIPQYDHACAFVVHFLVCNQVKVTAICSIYGQPNYPIKEPLHMKEPAICPK